MSTLQKYIIFLLLISVVDLLISYAQEEIEEANGLMIKAKDFVGLLVMEDFSYAVRNFDEAMKEAAPPEKLREIWKSLIAQAGSFKKEVGVRKEKYQEYDIVYVTCEFEKYQIDVKVVFDNVGRIAGLFFEQGKRSSEYKKPNYEKPDSFQDKEVVVGAKDWPLPGTLTLPQGNGPFPAVVLVHGSGPHDRDATIGPNKPFRDLACGLAARGIAVLRYEKRTKEHADKLISLKDSITVKEETIDDVLLAIDLLRKTEKIDTNKIFVLGHSLGGTLIPIIGTLDSGIAGLIIMAGSTRPLEDVIFEQMNYLFSIDDTITEDEKRQLEGLKRQVAKVKDANLSIMTPSNDLPLGISAKYWLYLRSYNPLEVAKNLKQPLLILQGRRDYQVTIADFQGWVKSLSSRKNVEFKLYPKLNHLFIEGEGKCTPDEYNTPGRVAEIVIDDIAKWIKKE